MLKRGIIMQAFSDSEDFKLLKWWPPGQYLGPKGLKRKDSNT